MSPHFLLKIGDALDPNARYPIFGTWNGFLIFYVVLIVFIVAVSIWAWRKTSEILPEVETMTLEDLSHFKQPANFDMKTYISIRGIIFDITDNEMFWPKGKYYKLAGTEASIALAKSDLGDKYVNSLDLSQLTQTERKFLNAHYMNFSEDYKVVGYLKEWGDKYGNEANKPPVAKEKTKRVLGIDTRKKESAPIEENVEKITIPPSIKESIPLEVKSDKQVPRNRRTKK
jgi:predicted heme/steroid binding protein